MLRREQRHTPRRTGFTLMEMLVVVAIIVALAGIGGFFLLGQLGQSQKDVARAQVKGTLTNAAKTFYMKHHQWPPTLDTLLVEDGKGGPYLEDADALLDPWGNPYQYDPAGTLNQGKRPDIWATAPDGQKIGNWSVLVGQ